MIRGTTPTLRFNLPFQVSIIDKLWLVFSQDGEERIFLDKSRCSLNGNLITVDLTQEETLKLYGNNLVEIQLRILTDDGRSLVSKRIIKPVEDVLRGGVI